LASAQPVVADAAASGGSDEKVLAKWSGSSDMATRPFHIDGPWELQWTTQAGYFSAALHRMSGRGPNFDLLANGASGGSSSSYQPAGGDFYLEFQGEKPWTARVVAVAGDDLPERKSQDQEPLLEVSGDQSDLPACDDDTGKDALKRLVENSSLGQTFHISVFHVGDIAISRIRDGMAICTASLITNAGEMSYSFQYYRKDGEIFISGKRNGS
jgi:hypothetical protein